MKKYLIFDLDGTLTDSGLGITNSVKYALEKYHIEVNNLNDLNVFVGPPLKDSFSLYYGFSEQQALEAIGYYREYFLDKGMYENSVYPNVLELLQKLKKNGKTLVIATSKPEPFTIKILKHFNLLQYFDLVCGASLDETIDLKKEDIIRNALKELNINVQDAIMIGDRKYDIIGAHKNNLDSIGVLYGYGSKEELIEAKVTYLASNTLDILKFV